MSARGRSARRARRAFLGTILLGVTEFAIGRAVRAARPPKPPARPKGPGRGTGPRPAVTPRTDVWPSVSSAVR